MLANDQKHYDNALTYYNKALQLIKQDSTISNTVLKANVLNNIGVAHRNKGDNKQALIYFTQALKTKELPEKVPFLYAMLLDNIAYSRFKLNDNTNVPDFFFKALHIRDSLHLISGMMINKLHLSEYYQAKKQPEKAITFAQEAYNLAKTKDKDPRNLLHALKQMQLVDANLERAYALEYIQLSDNIQKTEPLLHQTIIQLIEQNEALAQEKESLLNQNNTMLFWFSITGLVALLLFIIYATRKKLQLLKTNETIYNLILGEEYKIRKAHNLVNHKIVQTLYDHVLNGIFGPRLFLDTAVKRIKNRELEHIPDLEKYVLQLKKTEDYLRELCHDLTTFEKKAVHDCGFINAIQQFLEREQPYFKKITMRIDPAITWNGVHNDEGVKMYHMVKNAFKRIKKDKNLVDVNVAIYQENNQVAMNVTGKSA